MRDIGLSRADDRFQVVFEEELDPERMKDEVENPNPEVVMVENANVITGNVAGRENDGRKQYGGH